MNNIEVKTIKYNEVKEGGAGGYKVIEVNVSDPAESVYAVCTPIKLQ